MTSRISVIWHKMIFGERADVCGKALQFYTKTLFALKPHFEKCIQKTQGDRENVGCKEKCEDHNFTCKNVCRFF